MTAFRAPFCFFAQNMTCNLFVFKLNCLNGSLFNNLQVPSSPECYVQNYAVKKRHKMYQETVRKFFFLQILSSENYKFENFHGKALSQGAFRVRPTPKIRRASKFYAKPLSKRLRQGNVTLTATSISFPLTCL